MENNWHVLCMAAIEVHYHLIGDYKAACDRVDAALAKTKKLDGLRLQCAATTLSSMRGWRAAAASQARSLPRWHHLFQERLAEAYKLGEQAWNVKPHTRIAILMITINKGLLGDRAEMEKWFVQAMQLDGNCKEACEAKLDWLDPKWHGTIEEMMEFGYACRDTKKLAYGITLLLAEAHHPNGVRLGEKQNKYFHLAEVWDYSPGLRGPPPAFSAR